jgi:rhomboid protease GluP
MAATFGRKGRVTRIAPPQTLAQPTRPAAIAFESAGGVVPDFPLATIAISLALAFIFFTELKFPIIPTGELRVSPFTSEAFGAVSRHLVYDEGEVWRVLTASVLHGSISHLLGNLFAFVVVGFFLERAVGPKWLAAIFFFCGITGAIGTMAWTQSIFGTVGASGAIMGLFGAAIVCVMHGKGGKNRDRMLVLFVLMAIPALLPEVADDSGVVVDYSCHLVGFVGGIIAGLALRWVWPDPKRKPLYANTALAFVLVCLCGYALAFGAVAQGYPTHIAKAPHWAPPGAFTDKLTAAQTHDLLKRYPNDPKAHIAEGVSLLKQGQAAAAEYEFRFALRQKETVKYMSERSKRSMNALLAVALAAQRRVLEARDVAKAFCRSSDGSMKEVRTYLDDQDVCEHANKSS